MLGALFSSFQTSLGQIFSKPFAMGSLLPILFFFGASAGVATGAGGKAKDWADKVVAPAILANIRRLGLHCLALSYSHLFPGMVRIKWFLA